jgi:peptidoglycan-associated lipoprotein
MKSKSKFLYVLLALLILTTSGCSLFGGGKKKDGDDSSLSESDLAANQADRFGSGTIPTAEGEGLFRDIHFDYDSSAIGDTARQDIEYNSQVLQSNPDIRVTLEGHCDERGTEEYNLNLGASRARSVRDVLSSLGIAKSKIDTISYGENVPLALGHDEASYAKNRRVHFAALGGKSK